MSPLQVQAELKLNSEMGALTFFLPCFALAFANAILATNPPYVTTAGTS